jgi:hypothetical protein
MKRLLLVLLATLAHVNSARSAVFVFDFQDSTAVATQDPYYFDKYRLPNGSSADTTSRVYTTTAIWEDIEPFPAAPLLRASMSGRYYDGDPTAGSDWGLLDQNSEDFTERPELFTSYVLKYGVRPSALGSTVSALTDANGNLAPASYLEYRITSGEDIMFNEFSVAINNLVAIEATDVVWASADVDELNRVIQPTLIRDETGDKISLIFTWENLGLNQSADVSATIRIYGLKGSDYGEFTAAKIDGEIVPPPVPEASASILSMLGLAGLAMRRRRPANLKP